jgi:hypothetical protein
MKKITLLFLALGFSSFMSAQCLTTTAGQWPSTSYVPTTCDGYTPNVIVTDGFADEYSAVTVTLGQTYTFTSSKATDVVTISADAGATAAAFGIGSATWVATVSGDVWFYTNLNDGSCGAEFINRTRSVICGVPPSCIPPTTLSISNLATTTITLSWVASVSAPTGGYDYYYSTDSTTPPTATTTPSGSTASTVTTVNLTGLTPGGTYYAWVRSNCGSSSYSDWSAVYNFSTVCASSSVPYTQDFESATLPNVPSCTYTINAGAGNNWTVVNAPSTSFTSNTLSYSYDSNNPANAWFFTTGLDLTAGTSYDVTYSYGNNSSSYLENLKVACGTSVDPSAMTNILADHPGITGNTLNTETVTFTPITSGVYYFGFNAYSDANQYDLYVDDISISASLANATFAGTKFSFYPNPVKDVLNIGYSKTISQVTVYNIVGQEVAVKSINDSQSQIDMSNLSKGTYMVKVTSDGLLQTIKVVKD